MVAAKNGARFASTACHCDTLVHTRLTQILNGTPTKIVNDPARVTWDRFAVNFFEHPESGCRSELQDSLTRVQGASRTEEKSPF